MSRLAGAGLPARGDSAKANLLPDLKPTPAASGGRKPPVAALDGVPQQGAYAPRSPRMSRLPRVGLLEQVHPPAVRRGDAPDRVVAAGLLVPQRDQRIPERRPPDREANKPRHVGRGLEPVPHLRVVLAAAQHDAPDLVAPAAPARRHDL